MNGEASFVLVLSGILIGALCQTWPRFDPYASQILIAILVLEFVAALAIWMSPRALSRIAAHLRIRKCVLESCAREEKRVREIFERKARARPREKAATRSWPRKVAP